MAANSSIIFSGELETEEIAINNVAIVANFEMDNNNNVYFGFDWVKLQNSTTDEIKEHQGINVNKCSHCLDDANHTYTPRDNVKVQEILKDEFKIIKDVDQNNNEKRYSTQSWLHLPGLNVDIKVKMKLSGSNLPLVFEIPTGLDLSYTGGVITNGTPNVFSTNTVITIRATQPLGKAEVNIKRQDNGNIVGSLGVYAYNRINIDITLWTLVEDPSGSKIAEQLQSTSDSLKLNDRQKNNLKDKLDKTFHQMGINLTLQDGGYLTYDPNAATYKSLFSGSKNVAKENADIFFKMITKSADKIARLNKTNGINLIIADCSASTVMEGNTTAYASGIGYIASKVCIIYNQARSDFGVYAHEIGHTLGYIHSFYDTLTEEILNNRIEQKKHLENDIDFRIDNVIMESHESEPADINTYLNSTAPKAATDKMDYAPVKDKMINGEILEYEDHTIRKRVFRNYYDWKQINDDMVNEKRNQITCLKRERLLYEQLATKNVMDYNENNYKYYFKWQWEIGRLIAEKYQSQSVDINIPTV